MSVGSTLASLVAVLAFMHRFYCAAGYPLSRYGRSLAWAPLPLYYQRATRPLYYPDSDYYYPQPQEYYYPLPAYYMDQQRPYYYSSSSSYGDEIADPMGDVQEDMQQDEGMRGGEYGQETWYQDSNADANAKFLEDLILNQMYDGKVPEEEGQRQRWVYGEQVKSARPKPKTAKPSSKEDEDVRELKSLVRGPDRRDKLRKEDKMRLEIEDPFAAQMRPRSNNWDVYRSNNKRSGVVTESSPKAKPLTTTTTPPPGLDRGQKEVVVPRPAVARSHEPSVYDTIKKLLHMEDLAQGSAASRLQKRSFVDNEDSLVGQLGRLKDMS